MHVDVTDGCDCAAAELVRWVKGTCVELSVGSSLFHPVPRTGNTAMILIAIACMQRYTRIRSQVFDEFVFHNFLW